VRLGRKGDIGDGKRKERKKEKVTFSNTDGKRAIRDPVLKESFP
jgi:hypothetical protein